MNGLLRFIVSIAPELIRRISGAVAASKPKQPPAKPLRQRLDENRVRRDEARKEREKLGSS